MNEKQKLKIEYQVASKTNLIIKIQENIEKYKKFTIVNFYNPCDQLFTHSTKNENLILKMKLPILKLLVVYQVEIRFLTISSKNATLNKLKQNYLKKIKKI